MQLEPRELFMCLNLDYNGTQHVLKLPFCLHLETRRFIMCWTDSDTWFFVIFRSEVFLENCFNVLCIISLWWISLNWCTNVMLCFRSFSSGLSILGMLNKSRGSLSYLVTTDFTFVSSEFRVTFRVCDVLSLLTFVWVTLEYKRRYQQIANMFHLD